MVLTVCAEFLFWQFSVSAWIVLSTKFSYNDLQVPYTLGEMDVFSQHVIIRLIVSTSIRLHRGLHTHNVSVHLLLLSPHLLSNDCAYTTRLVRTSPQVQWRPGVSRTVLPGWITAASTATVPQRPSITPMTCRHTILHGLPLLGCCRCFRNFH